MAQDPFPSTYSTPPCLASPSVLLARCFSSCVCDEADVDLRVLPWAPCEKIRQVKVLFLALAALSMVAAEVQLKDTTFSMTFRVQKDQFDKALQETKDLLKFAEENKMSPNTVMFIRNARDKVIGALDEFSKAQVEEKKAEERKKGVTPVPTTLTDKDIGVKQLKGEAKKCNIKKHAASELGALLAAGKVNLKQPFIVTGGMPLLDTLRRAFTSEELLKNTEVELRYLSP